MSGRMIRWLSFAVYLAIMLGAFLVIDALMGSDRDSARYLIFALLFISIPFTPSSGLPWRWSRGQASSTASGKLTWLVGGIALAVGALLYHFTHHALIAAAGGLLCLLTAGVADEWTHRREYAAHARERSEWEQRWREQQVHARIEGRRR
jgi:hypothetical protein